MTTGITLEVTLKDFCEFVKCYCGTDNMWIHVIQEIQKYWHFLFQILQNKIAYILRALDNHKSISQNHYFIQILHKAGSYVYLKLYGKNI